MKIANIHKMEKGNVQAHGGQGLISVCRPLSSVDFVGPWHFVDYAILPPKTSIGLHRHAQNEEIYIVLSGQGLMTVNEEQRRVVQGDLILNPLGGVHGLVNDSEEELSLLVIEVGLEIE